ncbi:uncharacterized protein LOC132735292 [Ruditapes philippinarum]|uniref:uncharacterized protein LOC132735292 n=1 Tax=Ruditapes philippinarum TaxID=129788 RepID=UPI00295A7A06|nr:uncharacterized protein LOC132735292 [Ruditapes philippinarum]
MAKFVSLKRSKSEQDLNDSPTSEEKTHNGIKLLVQLAEGDLPVLEFLNDYIQDFLDGSYHGNTEFYLRSHQFVSQLEQFYREKNSQCPYYLISFFRHIITLVSETLFLSASSDVCKVAVDSVVVTSPRVKVRLRDLQANVAEIQDLTIKLEIDIIRHLKDSKNFHLNQFDSKAVITQTEQIWRLLRRCETPMKDVTMAVEKKALADRGFFQKASMGIGAVCAGRFLWSLWQGEDQEQLINAALWSVGTGVSGAVLQIPRARADRILEELARQKGKKEDLQDILKHWLIESDGLCAKLVLYSSFSGKQV